MKKLISILAATVLLIPQLYSQQVSVFPKKSFYIYAMGSFLNTYPDHLSPDKKSGLSLLFGAGFRLINFHNRYFLNIEIDHTGPGFHKGDYESKLSITNFKLSLSYSPKWNNSGIIFYTGLGVASMHYSNDRYKNHTETSLVWDGGVKIPFNSALAFRFDIKGYFDPDDSDLYVIIDGHGSHVEHHNYLNSLGISLSAGVELRF